MLHKEPFIAPDAVASRRPQAVEASFSVSAAIEARHAINGGVVADREAVEVVKDFLSMLIDAAKRNDGSFVNIRGEVL